MKYAVFIDIDGTLMYKGVIPEKNKEAIKCARKNGHKIFINTGRSYAYIPEYILNEIEFDGIVAGLGTFIIYNSKVIYSNPIPYEILEKTWHIISQYPFCFEGENSVFTNPGREEDEYKICYRPVLCADTVEALNSYKISKIKLTCQISDKDSYELSRSFVVYRHDTYTEMSLIGTGKATAMHRAHEYIGKDKFKTIAIGDSANDISMLSAADISISMGDGAKEVQSICDYISCDAKSGGVGQALHHFGLA